MKAKILQRNQRHYREKHLYLEIIISIISLLPKIFNFFMVFVKEITELKEQFQKGAVR